LYYTASGIVTHCRLPSGAQVERGLVLSQPDVEPIRSTIK